MTQQLAQASSDWRIRLGIAFVLLVATLGAVFALRNNAEAAFPSTTITLDSQTVGPVNPGDPVTYTVTLVTTAPTTGTDVDTTISFQNGLNATALTGNAAWLAAFPEAGCLANLQAFFEMSADFSDCESAAPLAAGTYTFTVTFAAPPGGIPAKTFGFEDSDGDIESVASLPIAVNGITNPADATNVVSAEHTFVWTLTPNMTCGSDPDVVSNLAVDAIRECTAADVGVPAGVTLVSGPTVSDTTMANSSTVTVVINSVTPGAYPITLDVKVFTGVDSAYIDTTGGTATKTYAAVADFLGTSVLNHVDIDQGSEDSSGNNGDGTQEGRLEWIDDSDDANESRHVVCIFDGPLLAADNAFLTWNFTTTAGPALAVATPGKVSGNDLDTLFGGQEVGDVPCYAFSSAQSGDIAITASYDPDGAGPVQPVQIAWAAPGAVDGGVGSSQPIVKEFNDIETTIIVPVSGTLGSSGEGQNDSAFAHTGEFANWIDDNAVAAGCIRDEQGGAKELGNGGNNFDGNSAWCGSRPNVDGTTIVVNGVVAPDGPAVGEILGAPGQGFIEYALGSHPAYDGTIDGVEQTFSFEGCGSANVENPQTGELFLLTDGGEATLINSDKGVGFKIYPNTDGSESTTNDNADCEPGDTSTITIESTEQIALDSPIDGAPDEEITIEWQAAPTFPKQPVLAWAGQRVILEHNWAFGGECFYGSPQSFEDSFYVQYQRQNQSPGGFVADITGYEYISNGVAVVSVVDNASPLRTGDPNSACVSAVVYESEDPGEIDVDAFVVEDVFLPEGGADGDQILSGNVEFLIYYMKFESLSLGIVQGSRLGHNSGNFSNSNPYDTSTDVTSSSSNVSADVLLRAKVRGWFTNSNPSGRPQEGNGTATRPANRWIMPDDWEELAGGDLAESLRPNYDIMIDPAIGSGNACQQASSGQYFGLYVVCTWESVPSNPAGLNVINGSPVVGPFSLVDGPSIGDSKAPLANVGGGLNTIARETWIADGFVTDADAPMPPAWIDFRLTGAGFLKHAHKSQVYSAGRNPYYVTHIPAEPWINPINPRGGQYLWDSYDDDGPYEFWQEVTHGSKVYSAGGADGSKTLNGPGKVDTGGYTTLSTYSDNHGESMVYVNGDAGLHLAGCQSGGYPFEPDDGEGAVISGGPLCSPGDSVGSSSVMAVADYPDKKKHPPIGSNSVSIDWLWGGHKYLTVEDGPVDFMKYVVLHLSDRDGYCGGSPSFHPVLGEDVRFRIDSTENFGIPIEDAAELGTIAVSGLQADVFAFDTDAHPEWTQGGGIAGECQAWILISNSLYGETDVKVTAFDPEGTVTFDLIVDIVDQTPEDFEYSLSPGWNLIVWEGMSDDPASLLGDHFDSGDISIIYGWDADAQQWLVYSPDLEGVGGNNLNELENGTPYWVYVTNPDGLDFSVEVPPSD